MWRTALKRIWHLPYNTHRHVIDAISCKLPIYDELCKRFLYFIVSCLNSHNRIVHKVTTYSLAAGCSLSPLGRNAIYVCSRYNITLETLGHFLSGATNIFNIVSEHSSRGILEHVPIDKINILLELIMLRDNIFEFVTPSSGLSREDIICLMPDICTN